MDLSIIILAAGQGKRMKTAIPKSLHIVGGKPLLQHVLDTAHALDPKQILLIHGHGGEHLQEFFKDRDLTWVEQKNQLGTGDAVKYALPHIPEGNQVLILSGDVPLTSSETLQRLYDATDDSSLGVVTAEVDNPHGYGRMVRDMNGKVTTIVESKDANEQQQKINEINAGIYLVPAKYLKTWVGKLESNNAQGEFYITDIVQMAATEGVNIATASPECNSEILGVNDRKQLATVERFHQETQANKLMSQGVSLRDPARFDLRGNLTAGIDLTIDINVIIEGDVTIGQNVSIGPGSIIKNSTIGDNVVIGANCVIENITVGNNASIGHGAVIKSSNISAFAVIKPYCHIDSSEVGSNCQVGPFAHLRPEAKLSNNAHVGNFVEIKKSVIGQGSKVNHLTYIGDAQIGQDCNIGAGVITCNYDGANKNTTTIKDNAFVGSNCQLVAPVTIGEGATIGAGSTISKDAPDGALTLTRAKQVSIECWKRPVKEKQ